MYTVCAWCNKVMNEGPKGVNGEISHGICLECKEQVMKDMKKPAKIS